MDATHFRRRAAHAREIAQSGDDIRLSQMLLEVAVELDAEAEAMETGGANNQHRRPQEPEATIRDAILHLPGAVTETWPVQIIALSIAGARFRLDCPAASGKTVILELPADDLRLDGRISCIRGNETTMAFEPAASADPGLQRLLRSDAVKVQACE